jgi:xanthine/uracil permease
MQLKYGLDEHPPLPEFFLFGLQWFAVTIPIIVIIGKVTAGMQFAAPEEEIVYLQKLSFVMAAALLVQVLTGHRLPLIIGPSSVLLVGIIASLTFGADAVYTAILLGGILLSLLSVTGLFAHLQTLFTSRIVAVVLLLIAFTLSPTILHLVVSPQSGSGPLANISFALALVIAMFFFHRHLRGIWKSTLIIWTMIAGSMLYLLLFPGSPGAALFHVGRPLGGFFRQATPDFTLHAGVLISFLFCFIALAVNDLGSIQSMNEILKPPGQPQRITRGIFVTGLANILAGLFGVIGPVNFSLSPGVLASTGCASRFTLLPAAALLCLVSFSPLAIALLGNVPSVVIGCVLLFIMCSQFGAGLSILFEPAEGLPAETGLIVGLPILLGTIIAFLPAEILNSLPAVLRPVLGNGFVVGVSAALVLEHLIFRDR